MTKSRAARWMARLAPLALLAFLPALHAQRSYVGRKLPAIDFVDTEGHTITPSHYEGSVLVMLTGIPW